MSGDTPKDGAVEPDAKVELSDIEPAKPDSHPHVSSRDIFESPETQDGDDSSADSDDVPDNTDDAPNTEDTDASEDSNADADSAAVEHDTDTPENAIAQDEEDGDNGEDDDDDNVLLLENSEEDTPEEILLSRLESLIFIYPEPITVRRLAKHLSLTGKRVRDLVEKLKSHYSDRGIHLSEISGGFQFHTSPQNADVIRTLTKVKPLRMSRPALETLAIVAYKQPCTRAEVEDVRRVDCGGTLKFLFEKELIRVLGRKEEPGRPIIYGTSSKFLELFNLKSLTDLPSLHEYTELWDEHKELIDEDGDSSSDGTAEQTPASTTQKPDARQQEIPVDNHLESHETTDSSQSEPADAAPQADNDMTDDADDVSDDADDVTDDVDDVSDSSDDVSDDADDVTYELDNEEPSDISDTVYSVDDDTGDEENETDDSSDDEVEE